MFYFPKNTFDGVPISIWNHLKSVAVFVKGIHQVIGVIDEEFDIIELVSAVQFG